jgi:transposase
MGHYVSPVWVAKCLDQGCARVMRSQLEPMKKVAKTIRAHKPFVFLSCAARILTHDRQLILNWFEARNGISLGVVEGQNNKAKVVIRKLYGFKAPDMLKIWLCHNLGKLQVPEGRPRIFLTRRYILERQERLTCRTPAAETS